jgi:2-hydroxychromene-2-carboxylate isomerase
MAADPIDFWFTMGSTYSYLSVMRSRRIRTIQRRPIPLATVPPARHPSGNEARAFRG